MNALDTKCSFCGHSHLPEDSMACGRFFIDDSFALLNAPQQKPATKVPDDGCMGLDPRKYFGKGSDAKEANKLAQSREDDIPSGKDIYHALRRKAVTMGLIA